MTLSLLFVHIVVCTLEIDFNTCTELTFALQFSHVTNFAYFVVIS